MYRESRRARKALAMICVVLLAFVLRPALGQSGLKPKERRAAQQISHSVSTTEWLGPLAPIALSPFFGITCLSGMAIFGADFLPVDHWIVESSTPLKNPLVFVIFLVLTMVTSLPKLSKVSKPIAQSVDRLETYSAIIVLIVIRYLGQTSLGGPEPQAEAPLAVHMNVYEAGIVDVGIEGLLAIAMAINVLVVNAVKFFCEMVIWITPIPFVDAAFEMGNKLTCAGLMWLYAFSPFLATCVNLVILFVCLLVFLWVRRRELYLRTLLMDMLISWFRPPTLLPTSRQPLIVFPAADIGPISKLDRCELTRVVDGWRLCHRRRLGGIREYTIVTEVVPQIRAGWIRNRFEFGPTVLMFGRRHNHQVDALARALHAECVSEAEAVAPSGFRNAAVELS